MPVEAHVVLADVLSEVCTVRVLATQHGVERPRLVVKRWQPDLHAVTQRRYLVTRFRGVRTTEPRTVRTDDNRAMRSER